MKNVATVNILIHVYAFLLGSTRSGIADYRIRMGICIALFGTVNFFFSNVIISV